MVRVFLKIIGLLGLFLCLGGYPGQAFAVISNGSTALNEGGQYTSASAVTFTQGGPNNGPNANGFYLPHDVEIDSVNKRLFVADLFNNRVLVFNLDASNQLVEWTADFVLGQTDFDRSVAGLTQSGMYQPSGLAYDSVGNRLFVVDNLNNRILVFDVTAITNGENAVNVLGQANFTSGVSATTQAGLNDPWDVFYDSGGSRLFVGDSTNNRVMVFDVAVITNGENAVNVLGREDFISSSVLPTSQSGFRGPRGLAYDSANSRLFVTDSNNNRVMVFDVAVITNGENAVNVLGQADFTSSSAGTTINSLNFPTHGAYQSSTGRLFVTDSNNNRVMIFDVAVITNGENAINVLGQANFTSAGTATTPNNFNTPRGMTLNGNDLFVVDYNNNRVLLFEVSLLDNGENAVNVVGQLEPGVPIPYYIKGGPNNGPYTIGFNSPYDVTLDTTNHRLFVSDTSNNRVLVFNLDTSDTLVDATADFVLGQANFVTNSTGTTQSTLNSPEGLTYQSSTNRLFVSDFLNNRIMIFDVAIITNGENAVNVLGQANFTSSGAATTSAGLNGPKGLAFNSTNNWLYVADSNNNRVMIFDVTAVGNGAPAMYVLGQANFTSAGVGTTQSTLNIPVAVAYASSTKRLYVADSDNRRVMVFNVDPFVINHGAAAINVLGQSLFTTNTAATTQSGFQHPQGLAYDNNNSYLFVSDATGASNHRVMAFDVTAITDGENAVNVLGQPNFTATGAATTQSRLSDPHGLFFSPTNGQLWVVDQDNHRLMVFDGAAAAPTTTSPTFVSQATNASGHVTLSFQVNDATPASGVQAKVEHSIDGGASWRTSYITSATASVGPAPNVDHNAAYPIGSTTRINMTYGANTLNPVIWDTKNALNGNGAVTNFDGNVLVRVTPSDGVTAGTAQPIATAFNVDNENPSTFTTFTSSAQTASSATLTWSAVAENHFNHYEIWYGTTQATVQGRTGGAQEWDNDNNAALATRTTQSTTITGLSSGLGYYFKIWGVDNAGNESTVGDILIFTQSGSSSRTTGLVASVNLKINLGAHRDAAFLRIVNQLLKGERMIRDRVSLGGRLRGRWGRSRVDTVQEIMDHAVFRATLVQLVTENPEAGELLRGQTSEALILEVWKAGDRGSPVAVVTVATNLFGEAQVSLPALSAGSYDFTIRKPFGLPQVLERQTLQSDMTLNFPKPIRVGDLDGDGKINVTDFKNFMQNFGNSKNDFNEDGKIDLHDVVEFMRSLE